MFTNESTKYIAGTAGTRRRRPGDIVASALWWVMLLEAAYKAFSDSPSRILARYAFYGDHWIVRPPSVVMWDAANCVTFTGIALGLLVAIVGSLVARRRAALMFI